MRKIQMDLSYHCSLLQFVKFLMVCSHCPTLRQTHRPRQKWIPINFQRTHGNLFWCLSLWGRNISTQVYTTHFYQSLYRSRCREVWTHHKRKLKWIHNIRCSTSSNTEDYNQGDVYEEIRYWNYWNLKLLWYIHTVRDRERNGTVTGIDGF